MTEQMREISSTDAWNFLKNKHYSGRKPNICIAFGWYLEYRLVAVCTFGKPVSQFLCNEICGEEYSSHVFELNRLCRVDDLNLPLSHFVAWCLRQLKTRDLIIVSYSDTSMHHNGYIYQACNFYYTGQTKQRTDKYAGKNKHSRHYKNVENERVRVVRSAKNRYVYFAVSSKKLHKRLLNLLKYKILPYPKEVNHNYVLGEFQKQVLTSEEDSQDEVYERSIILK